MSAGNGTAKRIVIITFDDGFQNFHTEAFPILKKFGFSATMFLPTGFIADSRKAFKGTPCLTWNEVRELSGAGMSFGGHTVTHRALGPLSKEELAKEIQGSKLEIEAQLGQSIKTFACPFAFPQANRDFVERYRSTLRESGHLVSVTTRIGRAHRGDDLFTLRRLPVSSADDEKLLEAKLQGSYDWLSFFQASVQKWKSRARSKNPASRNDGQATNTN